LIEAFAEMDAGNTTAYVNLTLGEQRFITWTDKPAYLLPYEEKAALQFAVEDRELVLFPSSDLPPEADAVQTIRYPSHWTKGVEPFLKFRLGNLITRRVNGVWVPLSTDT